MTKSSSEIEQQKYTCSWCDKKTVTHFTFEDELLCEDCFDDAESRVENAYDVARDEGKI